MKFTKEHLNEKTDSELNVILDILKYHTGQAGSQIASVFTPDYCNNPGVMWPLILEHDISIIKVHGGHVAVNYQDYIDIGGSDNVNGICADGAQFGHKSNALRAAVCCLILMLQNKAGN